MNDLKRESPAAPYGGRATTEELVSTLSGSARRARETAMEHPYFTAGLVAGLGVAIVGGIFFGMRRRRTLFERLFDL